MKMDHVARARRRVINQYRSKPRMMKWLTLLPEVANERIEQAAADVYASYDVDTVTDEQLDVIGRIVGIPRPVLRGAAYDVFGYAGNDAYTNYNVAPYIGDGAQVDALLNNDLYRKLIKAKIARNISDGTSDNIIQLLEMVIGIKVTALVSNGDKSFDIGIASPMDNTTKYLLENFDLVPRPQGTRVGTIFILPSNIDEIERTAARIFNYSNYTLPGDVS